MQSFTKNNPNMISNKDIFDIVQQRVRSENNGATVFVPHVCNNIDLFGAGFAAQVAEKFPTVKANYHMLGKNFLQKNMGYSQIVQVYEDQTYKHKLYIVNMIAQNGIRTINNKRPLNYYALCKSMHMLSNFIRSNKSDKVEIHCPRFGSGLAGGDWNFISALIEDVWSEHEVFVYSYNNNNRYNKNIANSRRFK